jgi:hypothetical protein
MTRLMFRSLRSRRTDLRTCARPMSVNVPFEPLEDRKLFSAHATATMTPEAAALVGHQVALTAPVKVSSQSASHAITRRHQLVDNVLPLKIDNIVAQGGQLVGQGSLGNTPFTAPLTLSTSPSGDPDCPILNLHLGPIHLNLLGLRVDTSEICLDITAEHGSGNLLGNLLCSVAHLLDTGVPLGTILNGLTTNDLNLLTSGLTGIINGGLGAATAPSAIAGVSGPHCDILNLSLGPVDLNLLGLDVHLDNCHNGPVTIDVTAVPGPGNLLGNLLCNLAHALDNQGHGNGNNITNFINRIAGEILRLVQ